MKHLGVVRLFAVVALAGQFQFLPATVACTLRHQEPAAHCDEVSQPTGSVVQTLADSAPVSCTAGGPCAMPGPVVVPLETTLRLAGPAAQMVAAGTADVPPSYSTAPVPPPPQS